MCRLLPLVFLVLAPWPVLGYAKSAGSCGPNVISNAPQCIAGPVFEGEDAHMPEDVKHRIAIEPVRDMVGKIVIPATIPEALKLTSQMLPHWYLNALRISRGDDECDVVVNGESYTTLISAWERANWQVNEEGSALHQQFTQLGFKHNDAIEQALVFGFCEYLKGDEKKAMETIQVRAAFDASR